MLIEQYNVQLVCIYCSVECTVEYWYSNLRGAVKKLSLINPHLRGPLSAYMILSYRTKKMYLKTYESISVS